MAVREGRRQLSWRNDKPSTLVYVTALDGGDPENEVSHRDQIFQIEAPFKGIGKPLLKTINRFYSISWGNDNSAVVYDYWWNTRNMKLMFLTLLIIRKLQGSYLTEIIRTVIVIQEDLL